MSYKVIRTCGENFDNYLESKEIINSLINNNLKKIFLFHVQLIFLDLSNLLCKENKKIIIGFGMCVDDEIVSDTVKYAKENNIILDKILDVWPFPSQLKESFD